MAGGLLWGQALHMAYPNQQPRYRPSGVANCARQQAGPVNGIEQNTLNYNGIWQQELGRLGQDMVLKALPSIGFRIAGENVKVEGELPGELDADVEVLSSNIFGIEPGFAVADVKVRNTYAYNFIWQGDDLLEVDQGVGVQINTYCGQYKRDRWFIILLPFDSAAVRNGREFNERSSRPRIMSGGSEYIRVFTGEFNPDLFEVTMWRKQEIEKAGLEVAPEFDPTNPKDAKFPCGYCGIMDWCLKQGQDGIKVPKLPTSGMPMRELFIP